MSIVSQNMWNVLDLKNCVNKPKKTNLSLMLTEQNLKFYFN